MSERRTQRPCPRSPQRSLPPPPATHTAHLADPFGLLLLPRPCLPPASITPSAPLLLPHSTAHNFALPPRSDKVVTGSFDKTAKVWSATTGECLHTYRGHRTEIVCASFDPNGSTIATVSRAESVWPRLPGASQFPPSSDE